MKLLTPIVTESAYAAQSQGKYYFWVNSNITKPQIKSAFINAFGVNPTQINLSLVRGKIKTNRRTGHSYAKSLRKKAIVTTPKGTKIAALSLAADAK